MKQSSNIFKNNPYAKTKFGGIIDQVQTQNASLPLSKLLPLLDLDNQLIYVPYISQNHTLQEFIQCYLKITKNKIALQNSKRIALKNITNNFSFIDYSIKVSDFYDFCLLKVIKVELANQQIETNYKPIHKQYQKNKYVKLGQPIQIKIKYQGNQIIINCLSKDPVGKIKEYIQQKTGLAPQSQNLMYGTQLFQHQILSEKKIKNNQCLILIQRIMLGQSQIMFQGVFNIIIKTQDGKKANVSVDDSQYIDMVKQQIGQKIKMKPSQFRLILAGKTLQDNKSLSDYNIKAGTLLYAIPLGPIKHTNKDSLLVTIKVSQQQKLQIPFGEIKIMRVSEIIKYFVENSSRNLSFIYSNKVLDPNKTLSQIQDLIQMNQAGFTLLVFRSEKYFFEQKIKPNAVFQQQKFPLKISQEDLKKTTDSIKEKVSQKQLQKVYTQQQALEVTRPEFYYPIQVYTSSLYYQQINAQLRKITTKRQDLKKLQQSKNYNFICSLIERLKKVPSYVGAVYRGMYNYEFSKWHAQKQLICWQGFTSTSKNQQIAADFQNSDNKYSFFHIKSITGKQIQDFSLYSYEKQVLFMPYTYFYIEAIKIHEKYDEVWITQVPSPFSFKKNTIVWVDDNPQNNVPYFKYLLKHYQLQIIPITSTQIAQVWMKQFNQLYIWMDIKFKLVTDMVRQQKSFFHTKEPNYYAAIDLLELFYNRYGFTTKILIFCGDVNKALQNVRKRNIRPNRHKMIQITNGDKQLVQYCRFDSQLL